jgi:hypothetical protein
MVVANCLIIGEFIAFNVALVRCLAGPYIQLAVILSVTTLCQCYFYNNSPETIHNRFFYYVSVIFSKHILFASDDWMLTGLLGLAFTLGIGLTAIFWFAISTLVYILSTIIPLRLFASKSTSSPTYFVIQLSIVVGLLSFVPPSVIFTVYYIVWLLMTGIARASAKSDLPSFQNVYHYRLSWLVYLTSFLPYYVPQVIVYAKDLLIRWNYHPVSFTLLLQDTPSLLTLVYLVTIGKNPDSLELK